MRLHAVARLIWLRLLTYTHTLRLPLPKLAPVFTARVAPLAALTHTAVFSWLQYPVGLVGYWMTIGCPGWPLDSPVTFICPVGCRITVTFVVPIYVTFWLLVGYSYCPIATFVVGQTLLPIYTYRYCITDRRVAIDWLLIIDVLVVIPHSWWCSGGDWLLIVVGGGDNLLGTWYGDCCWLPRGIVVVGCCCCWWLFCWCWVRYCPNSVDVG